MMVRPTWAAEALPGVPPRLPGVPPWSVLAMLCLRTTVSLQTGVTVILLLC